MEKRNYGIGRRERRRLINQPDIIFQSPEGDRQMRVVFKGTGIFGRREIIAHMFKQDSGGRPVINGEFTRLPDSPRNRDRLWSMAAIKGCNQRLRHEGNIDF